MIPCMLTPTGHFDPNSYINSIKSIWLPYSLPTVLRTMPIALKYPTWYQASEWIVRQAEWDQAR